MAHDSSHTILKQSECRTPSSLKRSIPPKARFHICEKVLVAHGQWRWLKLLHLPIPSCLSPFTRCLVPNSRLSVPTAHVSPVLCKSQFLFRPATERHCAYLEKFCRGLAMLRCILLTCSLLHTDFDKAWHGIIHSRERVTLCALYYLLFDWTIALMVGASIQRTTASIYDGPITASHGKILPWPRDAKIHTSNIQQYTAHRLWHKMARYYLQQRVTFCALYPLVVLFDWTIA